MSGWFTLPGYTWCNRRVTEFQERLAPAWWMVLALFLAVPTTLLIFLPVNPLLGVLVGLALWLLLVGLLWWSAPIVSLDGEVFRAGRARIERRYIAGMEALDGEEARAQKGTQLDARAFLVIRPWVHPVVKVTLNDPADPTPYWLVSTRDPERIVQAWRARQTQP